MNPRAMPGQPAASLPPGDRLYILGVGGPEDASGIGLVDRFVWRFAVLETPGCDPLALAFRSMPGLMRFTRAVNERRPFCVPTEVFRVQSEAIREAPARLLLDPEPETFLRLIEGRELVERRIPELEG